MNQRKSFLSTHLYLEPSLGLVWQLWKEARY